MGEEAYEETRFITDRATLVIRGGYGRHRVWLGLSPGRNEDDHPDIVIEMGQAMRRRVADAIMTMGPVFPRCFNCGCPAEDHVVDDEELRECTACECKQYEVPR